MLGLLVCLYKIDNYSLLKYYLAKTTYTNAVFCSVCVLCSSLFLQVWVNLLIYDIEMVQKSLNLVCHLASEPICVAALRLCHIRDKLSPAADRELVKIDDSYPKLTKSKRVMNSKLQSNGYKCPPSLKCSPWTLILQLLCCQLKFDNRKFSFLFCWSSTKRWQNDKYQVERKEWNHCRVSALEFGWSEKLWFITTSQKNQDLGARLSKAHHLFPLHWILLSLKPPSVLQLFFLPTFWSG